MYFAFANEQFQMYRHGDRNIVGTYPNDPYKNETYYWPEGFGELTNVSVILKIESNSIHPTCSNQNINKNFTCTIRLESDDNMNWVNFFGNATIH